MQKSALQAAAIVLLTLLAYFPATRAGFIWDDDYYVTRNFSLRSSTGLSDLWLRPGVVPQYYPVTHTTFWLEYRLWGLQPAGYHIVNILLHATNAVLLWIILRQLKIPGVWIAACVFAVHPVHVESVAWITERKNVLSGMFYLAALLTYLPLIEQSPRERKWRYALTIVLFILALLSKSVTASLPAAILLIAWWKRGRIESRDIVPLLPLFALGLGMGYFTAQMEHNTVGAWGPEWNFSRADRILIAGRALWFYAAKLIWPAKLTFIYPRWKIDPAVPWQWIFPLAAAALVAGAWILRNRIGRGAIVALLFFGGTLIPALGFVNIFPMRYSFVADHFQYLASIGLIVLIVAAGARWMSRSVATASAAILLVALGLLTFRQTFIYRDLRTLWLDTIAKNPDCWMARNNYARILLDEKDLPGAREQLEQSLAVNPRNPEALVNLGVLLEARGQNDEAVKAYQSALEIGRYEAVSGYRLGRLLTLMGQPDKGLFYLNQTLDSYPNYAPAHEELARILFARGRIPQAIEELQRAIALDPDLVSAQFNLANVLIDHGRTQEGEAMLRDLARRFPKSQATTQPK